MLRQTCQFLGDPLRRKDEIYATGGDGAARHPVELRRFGLLREGHASRGFDRLDTGRSIRRRSGQDHPGGARPPCFGQRIKKIIDRQMMPRGSLPALQVKHPVHHAHVRVGRDDVHVIRLHTGPFADFAHRHFGGARQQRGQHAIVLRLQVLHQYKRQAGIDRQRAEDLPEGFQSSGGGADSHHRRGRSFRFRGRDRLRRFFPRKFVHPLSHAHQRTNIST